MDRRMKSMTLPGLDPTYKFSQEASDFSTSTAYAAGAYCIYQGALYRFTTAHAAGAWNAAHVTEVKIGEELAGLVTDLKAGTQATADLHLGFYLDGNGDLCQVDE